MIWIDAYRQRRAARQRLNKIRVDIASTIFEETFTGSAFTAGELQYFIMSGCLNPLGFQDAWEYFNSSDHLRFKFLVSLKWLLIRYTDVLVNNSYVSPEFGASKAEVADAVDPILDYLLHAFEFIFKNAGGISPGCSAAFLALPQDKCGKKTHAHIAAILRNEKRFARLRELANSVNSKAAV